MFCNIYFIVSETKLSVKTIIDYVLNLLSCIGNEQPESIEGESQQEQPNYDWNGEHLVLL